MELTLKSLAETFVQIHKNGGEVFIELEMEGFEGRETIINPHENILPKLIYYIKTYDNDLRHKHAQGIRIVSFGLAKKEGA